jgi:hypothetical protein
LDKIFHYLIYKTIYGRENSCIFIIFYLEKSWVHIIEMFSFLKPQHLVCVHLLLEIPPMAMKRCIFSPSEELIIVQEMRLKMLMKKSLILRTFKAPLMKGKNVTTIILLSSLIITSMMWTILKTYFQEMILVII